MLFRPRFTRYGGNISAGRRPFTRSDDPPLNDSALPWRIITGMGRWLRAGIGIGAGSVAVPLGIGWFYTNVLLDTSIRPLFPEVVRDSDAGTVTLTHSRLAAQARARGPLGRHE